MHTKHNIMRSRIFFCLGVPTSKNGNVNVHLHLHLHLHWILVEAHFNIYIYIYIYIDFEKAHLYLHLHLHWILVEAHFNIYIYIYIYIGNLSKCSTLKILPGTVYTLYPGRRPLQNPPLNPLDTFCRGHCVCGEEGVCVLVCGCVWRGGIIIAAVEPRIALITYRDIYLLLSEPHH